MFFCMQRPRLGEEPQLVPGLAQAASESRPTAPAVELEELSSEPRVCPALSVCLSVHYHLSETHIPHL